MSSRSGFDDHPHLRPLIDVAAKAGIFTDFDGSLSEIVDDPEAARAVPGACESLAALTDRFAIVAVISGRDMAALSDRVDAPGVMMLGSYGLEEQTPDGVRPVAEIEPFMDGIARAHARLAEVARAIDGATVERKSLSVALHVRRAADPEAAFVTARSAAVEIANDEGLDVLPGRRVVELRPRVAVDKGRTVARIAAEHGLRGALVAGDDLGDVAMFDAVGDLDVAVRVAVESAEAPAELLARADIVLPHPAALVELFRSLASASDP